MKLTAQQEAILSTNSNIRVDAVAGSGKTTTLVAYAASRPKNSAILYLAFNKSVREQAIAKCAAQGLTNVTVETAHSLAFKHIVIGQGYTVKSLGTHDLWIALRCTPPSLMDLLTLTHAQRFAAYFCNSAVQKVQELTYTDILSTPEEQDFVMAHYANIELLTREYLAAMYKRTIPISHDFYLKLFHLSRPTLGYHYILFDEAQDASPVMIDVVASQQRAIKVIAGDTHQQIYRWRHAQNAMRSFEYPVLPLSESFRLPPPLAQLAQDLLAVKILFMPHTPVTIIGHAKSKVLPKTRVTIGRTNIGLLKAAIEYLGKRKTTKKIYFEGNINSYLFGEEGGNLSDVLNLHKGKLEYIKNPVIMEAGTLDALEEYAEKTGDIPLQQVIDLVQKQGDELPSLIAKLRRSHCDDAEKHSADMHFSTVHRCKGLEYDEVFLCDDFLSEKALQARLLKSDDTTEPAAFEEEINLLYVAATRTKQRLHIPNSLLPEECDIDETPHLILVEDQPTPLLKKLIDTATFKPQGRRRPVKRASAGTYWQESEEKYLRTALEQGFGVPVIADTLGRSRGAVRSRMEKLGLEL